MVNLTRGYDRNPGTLCGMGFDATRKQVRRKSDYVMVVVALLVCAALVAWAFLG